MSQLKLYLIIAVIAATGGALLGYFGPGRNNLDETFKRQISGNLTKIEQRLQEADSRWHTINSELVQERELDKLVKQELNGATEQIKALKSYYKLQTKSFEEYTFEFNRVIESTKETIGNLIRTIPVAACSSGKPIPYSFVLLHKSGQKERIRLDDWDICRQGNERLTLNQAFTVKAVGYVQRDGFLETKQVFVNEIDPMTKEVIDSIAVDANASKFVYSVARLPQQKFSRLNLLVSYDSRYALGVGLQFLRLARVGAKVGYHHNFETDDKDLRSRVSGGLVYHLRGKKLKTNLGLGAGVSTPVQNLGKPWLGYAEITFDLLK